MAKQKKTDYRNNEFQTPRYINPFTDFGFKKIFGEEPNKDLLIDFVNQLLKTYDTQIVDLTYKKTERLGRSMLDRKVVFDLYCESEKGEKFIVEMQKIKQVFFKDRSIYYATFPIQEQGLKKSEWDYQLKSVFAIAVLDFPFNKDDKDNQVVINNVQLIDKDTCKVFYDKLTFIYVQIPNFNKSIDQLETRLDQWLYVLKNLTTFERIPEKIKDKLLQKVFKIAEFENLNTEEKDSYEDSLKYYRDLKNSLTAAELDGFKKAQEQYAQELEQVLQEKEQALQRETQAQQEKELAQQEKELAQQEKELAQQEKKQAMRLFAKKLRDYGEPIDLISKQTGLSVEEIEEL